MRRDDTVLDYFASVYLPQQFARRRMTKTAARAYGHAIERLEDFAGEPIRCSDVTVGLLRGFEVWCQGRYRSSTIKIWLTAVRRVVWHWNPQQFASVDRLQPHFPSEDVRGTLDSYFFNQFVVGRRIRARRTVRQYGSTLRLFAEQLKRPALPADLNDEGLATFVAWLLHRHGNTQRTAANHLQRLAALWRWATEEQLVEQPPTWGHVTAVFLQHERRRRRSARQWPTS